MPQQRWPRNHKSFPHYREKLLLLGEIAFVTSDGCTVLRNPRLVSEAQEEFCTTYLGSVAWLPPSLDATHTKGASTKGKKQKQASPIYTPINNDQLGGVEEGS